MTENAKAVLKFAADTVEIEGSQGFIADCVAKFPARQAEDPNSEFLMEQAVRHAWDWFALHAGQRMQGVNFFLIAAAFLSAAYVSAMQYAHPVVAIGVAALGVLFSVVFYAFEVRIRELIKTGEKALSQAQQKLAKMTGLEEFEICRLVEKPKYPITSYHQVIRGLYFLTGATFFVGGFYALRSLSPAVVPSDRTAELMLLVDRLALIVSACLLLFWAQRLALRGQAPYRWLSWVMALAFASAGVVALVLSALGLSR
ncbi:MAG: hypothetical protein WBW38_11540 [Candidatus Sulfotelmatobacter sp.]